MNKQMTDGDLKMYFFFGEKLGLKSNEILTYAVLFRDSDQGDLFPEIDFKEISKYTGLKSKKSIMNILKKFEDRKLITLIKEDKRLFCELNTSVFEGEVLD